MSDNTEGRHVQNAPNVIISAFRYLGVADMFAGLIFNNIVTGVASELSLIFDKANPSVSAITVAIPQVRDCPSPLI